MGGYGDEREAVRAGSGKREAGDRADDPPGARGERGGRGGTDRGSLLAARPAHHRGDPECERGGGVVRGNPLRVAESGLRKSKEKAFASPRPPGQSANRKP